MSIVSTHGKTRAEFLHEVKMSFYLDGEVFVLKRPMSAAEAVLAAAEFDSHTLRPIRKPEKASYESPAARLDAKHARKADRPRWRQ